MKIKNLTLYLLMVLMVQPAWSASQKEVEQFCTNIADPARERRYALKKKELEKLRERIEMRMKALQNKRDDLDVWVSKRDAFVDMAKESLVDIYSKMRPDAAAERLSMLSDGLAAAILMKLKPSKAGVILNEMKTAKAAAISTVIAASGAGSKS